MNVLEALERVQVGVERHLELELATIADDGRVLTDSRPRPGTHGHHTVTWLQDGRNRSAEGSTREVALRRALRASGAVSSNSTAKG